MCSHSKILIPNFQKGSSITSKNKLNVILLRAGTLGLLLIIIHLVYPHRVKAFKLITKKLTVISLRYFKCGSTVSNLMAFPPTKNGLLPILVP